MLKWGCIRTGTRPIFRWPVVSISLGTKDCCALAGKKRGGKTRQPLGCNQGMSLSWEGEARLNHPTHRPHPRGVFDVACQGREDQHHAKGCDLRSASRAHSGRGVFARIEFAHQSDHPSASTPTQTAYSQFTNSAGWVIDKWHTRGLIWRGTGGFQQTMAAMKDGSELARNILPEAIIFARW